MIGRQPKVEDVSLRRYEIQENEVLQRPYHENQIGLFTPSPFQGIFFLLVYRRGTTGSILRHDFLLDKNIVDQAINDMRAHWSVRLGP